MTAITLPGLLSLSLKPLRLMLLNVLIEECDKEVSVMDMQINQLHSDRRHKINRQIRLIERRNELERRQ